jgi:hypothetical protein
MKTVLHHFMVGFLFSMPLLGFLTHVLTYVLMAMFVEKTSENDILIWKISIWICNVVALIISSIMIFESKNVNYWNKDLGNQEIQKKYKPVVETNNFGVWILK